MSWTTGHLIVVSPRGGHLWQFRFSKTAIGILAAAFVLSFALMVLIGYTFPPLVTDLNKIRLETENRTLLIQNKNLEMKMKRLSGQIVRLEEASGRIVHRLEAD